MPHQAADPIPIACEIVSALQAMVTRRVDAFDPAVVTVAKIRAGTTHNVIPETATLWGTIRTVSENTRNAVIADIERVAKGIATSAQRRVGKGSVSTCRSRWAPSHETTNKTQKQHQP